MKQPDSLLFETQDKPYLAAYTAESQRLGGIPVVETTGTQNYSFVPAPAVTPENFTYLGISVPAGLYGYVGPSGLPFYRAEPLSAAAYTQGYKPIF